MTNEELIEVLNRWADNTEASTPTDGTPLRLAAKRLELAERLITNMAEHDGAEGFSVSTYALLEEWDIID